MQLRDYQERGANDLRAQFSQGFKRPVYVGPCGCGKTRLMSYMATEAEKRGNRTMFIVHRRELIEQASDTLTELDIEHGVISPEYEMTDEYIQIASVQTLGRRLNFVKKPDLIILDESHHATARTWRNVIEAFPDAYVVGLTATPARLGGQGLGDIFDSMVMGPSAKELIAAGHLAPYKYYAPPVVADLDGLKMKMGDFDLADIGERVDRPKVIGNAVETYLKLAPGKRTIAYCANRAHSQHTAEAFTAAGIPAMHIDGTTPTATRKQAIDDFRTGRIKVLSNVDLVSEGFDVPAMEAVSLLRPTASLTLFIQQAMRPMRPDKNNPDKMAMIFDHVGNVLRHGLPDDDREWSLDGVQKCKKISGPTVGIRQCLCCYAAHAPAPVCPYCGYQYQISARQLAEEAGELELYDAAERAAEEERRKQLRKQQGMAKTQGDLEKIVIERNYSPWWIKQQCKAKHIHFDQVRMHEFLRELKTLKGN